MSATTPSFLIGTRPIYGRLILAPMVGISDLPYRSLCRQFGSAMSCSSFVDAIELLQGHEKAWVELDFLQEERPVALQIFDHDIERIFEAAQKVSKLNPDMIDINMGCSVRRVSGRGAGAGLLREPKKISRIIQSLSNDLDLSITAKIRLGWDRESLNYLEIARRIEDSGGSLFAVHARTREHAYAGSANWDAIGEIKQALTIPVLGNGDVETVEDIDRLMDHSVCDAVMIGRGAIGNPCIFQRRDQSEISLGERAEVISTHLTRMLNFYGLERGLLLFRKHLVRYLRPLNLEDSTRKKLLTCSQMDKFVERMSGVGLQLIDMKSQISQAGSYSPLAH